MWMASEGIEMLEEHLLLMLKQRCMLVVQIAFWSANKSECGRLPVNCFWSSSMVCLLLNVPCHTFTWGEQISDPGFGFGFVGWYGESGAVCAIVLGFIASSLLTAVQAQEGDYTVLLGKLNSPCHGQLPRRGKSWSQHGAWRARLDSRLILKGW